MKLSPHDIRRLEANLTQLRERIAAACALAGRDPAGVRLVAVSKYAGAAFAESLLDLGQLDLGENRVQHLLALDAALLARGAPRPRWHMIGHLQRNKVNQVAGLLHSLHSLDGLPLATRLDAARDPAGAPLEVYVQVKLVPDAAERAGVAPEDLPALWSQAGDLTRLTRAGLMGLPPQGTPDEARPHFRRLRELAEQVGAPGLSMGMTADLEVAIEQGASVVRVGSALLEGLSPDARLP